MPADSLAKVVEDYLGDFQTTQVTGLAPRIEDYLPDPDHPRYVPVLVELVKIDMRERWDLGEQPPPEVYFQRFPRLFPDLAARVDLLFEDYRQHLLAGGGADPENYRQRFGIDVSAWPREAAAIGPSKDALPEVGQQFLGFRLLHELGRGAFAVVYLAHQHDLCNRLVALKVSTDLSVEPNRLAQLHHTNVVPICSVHRRGQLQAICMPYFGGTTVADVCASLGRQPRPTSGKAIADVVRQRQQQLVKAHSEPACRTSTGLAGMDAMTFADAVLQLASQLADALSHAHARGIIHRDLKPANVLITDDGQPMLLDFNVADDVKQSSPDLPAYVGGTLPYASPEQLEVLSGTPDSAGRPQRPLLPGTHPLPAPLRGAAIPV